MSHFESVTWILFCFFSLFNQCVLVSSQEFASGHSIRHRFVSRTWTEWSAWSECSRTCGGGVRQRTRTCKVRMVEYRASSNTCGGDRIEYEICSRHACHSHDDFLAYQCSKRNGQVVSGRKIEEWIPYRYGKGNPCELQCWANDRSLVYSFGKAIDGTPCPASDPKDPALCVNGRCTPVDCAGQLGTDNRRDICGVCRGENATCIKHHSVFWKRPRPRLNRVKDRHYDYNDIFTIPAGATHIKVTEDSESNFLVLGDHKDNYVINGNWRVQSPGRFLVHGSEFLYNRALRGYEELTSTGPTRSPLNVLVLGTGDIPTIHYEYWLSTFKPHFPHPLLPVQTPATFIIVSERPLDNTIDSAPSKTLPSKLQQGYKSFYHRNEILKSVPSWSIKRHRNHKNPLLLASSDSKNRTLWEQNHRTTPTLVVKNTDRSIFEYRNGFDKYPNRTASRNRTTPTLVVKNTDKSIFEYRNGFDKYPNRTEYKSDARFFKTTVPLFTVVTTTPSSTTTNEVSAFRYNGRGSGGTSAFTRTNRVWLKKDEGEVVTRGSVGSKEGSGDKHGRKGQKSKRKEAEKTSLKRRRKSNNGCPACPKVKQQAKHFCKSDFVLRATVLSIEKLHKTQRFEMEVTQSFKNRVPILSREYVWSSDSIECSCPRLREGREYILMGRASSAPTSRESRLVLDRDSFVRRYSQKKAKAMLKLVRDQGVVCGKEYS